MPRVNNLRVRMKDSPNRTQETAPEDEEEIDDYLEHDEAGESGESGDEEFLAMEEMHNYQ